MRVRYINKELSFLNMKIRFNYLDLLEFLPNSVLCGKEEKEISLYIKSDDTHIFLSYLTSLSNQTGKVGTREYALTVPRFISQNKKTFEIFGLLQSEMGKTNNGNLSFSNHEFKIINPVMCWFEKEFELKKDFWRWSIKLNMLEPVDETYKKEVEEKVIRHWLNKTSVSLSRSYPKKVTYIKNTAHTKLKLHDYGTLVLEHKHNLFSQIIKKLVRKITYEKILTYGPILIQGYMRGIFAGEATIDLWKPDKRYRVYISVTKEQEKEIFYQCLQKVGIDSIKYPGDKLIVSKRENNAQLLKQRLMTLSPEKYAKFLSMMKLYPNIKQETGYFQQKGKNIWHKIPQWKTDNIIELYKTGTTRTKDIAEQLGISKIKVNRVLRENNLGRKVIATHEEKRKEIAQFAKENISMNLEKIAEHFKVHRSVVGRANLKYNGKRGMKANCKIPEEKIQKIVAIYKEKPTVKFSEIMKELNISSTVIKRVRREHNLGHLGFKHLIGNNNKKAERLNL